MLAADVVASLKRWGQRNDSYGQALLDAAVTIEALDDMRSGSRLKRAFPVIDALATPSRASLAFQLSTICGCGRNSWSSPNSVS